MDYSHSLLQTLEAEKKCVQLYANMLDAKTVGGIHSMSGTNANNLKPTFRPFSESELIDIDARLKSIGKAIDQHRATIRDYFNQA